MSYLFSICFRSLSQETLDFNVANSIMAGDKDGALGTVYITRR